MYFFACNCTPIDYSIFFSQVLGLSLGLFYCILIFVYLILGLPVTTEIRFFVLKSKKEKVLDRDQNGF